MWVLEIVGSCWVAWSCAGLFAVIAVCSVFRAPLGLESLMIKLDTQALATQTHIIKTQERMIETQQKLIETMKRQLRMEGINPWEDLDDDEVE